MSEVKSLRLGKVAKEFNVGISTIVEFLEGKGYKVESNPNTKIEGELLDLIESAYSSQKKEKLKSKEIGVDRGKRETITLDSKVGNETKKEKEDFAQEVLIKNLGFDAPPIATMPELKEGDKRNQETIKAKVEQKNELVIKGKVDLDALKKPKKKVITEPEQPKVEKVLEKVENKATEVETPALEVKEDIVAKPEKIEEVEKTSAKLEELGHKTEVISTEIEKKTDEKSDEIESDSQDKASEEADDNHIKIKVDKLEGLNVLGKISLPTTPEKKKTPFKKDVKQADPAPGKKKRKRIIAEKASKVNQAEVEGKSGKQGAFTGGKPADKKKGGKPNQKPVKEEPNEEEIQRQIKETLARLSERSKSKSVKFRRQKREDVRERMEEELMRAEEDKKILKITEFVSANELATFMDVPVTNIISACMSLGLFVSINQRLDAETIAIIAEEFGFKVEFIKADDQIITDDEDEDDPSLLEERPPIVTVMGHVDHGKTSLLDFIRKANVIAGEAGGITQHIGAYGVQLDNGRKITFIDTPGHEAFTAMRARGAKVTDVAIIVIAADDSVMPQTIEAINHAQAAGVPMVFAINKIDKPGANPDKIREALANMNILVEDWGGKYQCQEISAKKGLNIDKLLDKVLLESEILELKANKSKRASGTVIEATMEKGRGYVCTLLVQNGTLKIGDVILAGPYSGKVKAMFNERGSNVKSAGPSTPIRILGLSGAPQAGDLFSVFKDEKEAKEIANKRQQLLREQSLRVRKHITLDEIGRRIAIGDFKQLNIIVKGDTDGSVEALTDSLLKLSTDSIVVNIIHKAVGQISESDVLLASASDAIIVGFQVRPSQNARKIAENEEIDIRTYSVIYKAIEEVKAAMEGMLSPDIEEKVVANIEVRDVFMISKVGAVAGCYVLDGKFTRNHKIRLIRDGIVMHTGTLDSLKRFKDDVKEVSSGYECGLTIKNYNDIQVGDIIEAYEEREVARKL